MLLRSPKGQVEFVDFRETAPSASTEDMFVNNVNASLYGGLARYGRLVSFFHTLTSTDALHPSGVPGVIRGLEYLHTKHATLPWSVLIQPAIRFARDGFVIGQDLAGHIARTEKSGLFLRPAWAPDFAPEGTTLRLGDTLRRVRYAETLQSISDYGPDIFYSGHIADTMVSAVAEADGILTLEDLEQYKVAIRKPWSLEYGDYRLHGACAPAGGPVALSILNIFKGFQGVSDPPNLNLTTHRLDEAVRFGYGMVRPPHAFRSAPTTETDQTRGGRGPSLAIPTLWMAWKSTSEKCSLRILRPRFVGALLMSTLCLSEHTTPMGWRVWTRKSRPCPFNLITVPYLSVDAD